MNGPTIYSTLVDRAVKDFAARLAERLRQRLLSEAEGGEKTGRAEEAQVQDADRASPERAVMAEVDEDSASGHATGTAGSPEARSHVGTASSPAPFYLIERGPLDGQQPAVWLMDDERSDWYGSWTADPSEARKFATEVEAELYAINWPIPVLWRLAAALPDTTAKNEPEKERSNETHEGGLSMKWEIFKAECGMDTQVVEAPDGFEPLAFIAADQQPATGDAIIGKVVFARKGESKAAVAPETEREPAGRPLDNYQIMMRKFQDGEWREQTTSVRDLAFAMRAIMAYDEDRNLSGQDAEQWVCDCGLTEVRVTPPATYPYSVAPVPHRALVQCNSCGTYVKSYPAALLDADLTEPGKPA